MNGRTQLAAALLALACTSLTAGAADTKIGPPALILLVRHAERPATYDDETPLTPAGNERAEALSRALERAGVGAIVTSATRRAWDTAAPLAKKMELKAVAVGGSGPAHVEAVVAEIRRHPGEVVLVVGHGNTVPAVIAALGGPALPNIPDGEYANLYMLVPGRDGARLVQARYGAPDCPATSPQENETMARRVFDEILNRGRYEVFQEIYSTDFVKHVDLQDETLAQEIEDAKGTRAAASDLVMTVDDMLADGDRVAIRYTGRGTNDGPLGGLPATGRRLEVTGTTIYRFACGRIAEEWTTYNMMEILRQLGHLPGARDAATPAPGP